MVKRTLMVLGMLSLMLATAGMASAQCGGNINWCQWPGADCGPLYVGVDCVPYPTAKTVIKTWSCKIEGPCPPPAPACGVGSCDTKGGLGLCTALWTGLMAPIDWLFAGTGVYGCSGFGGICGPGGPCGPGWGPLPAVSAAVPMALAAPSTMFGVMW